MNLASVVADLLERAEQQLGMDVAFLGEFSGGDEILHTLPHAQGELPDGTRVPASESFCSRMLDGSLDCVVSDTHLHPVTRDLAATSTFGVRGYVGVPVHLPDGSLFGALCCATRSARPDLSEQDAAFLRLIADMAGERLAHTGRASAGLKRRRQRIHQVIADEAIRMVFQPIYALERGRAQLSAVEALARFDTEEAQTPDVWFAEAGEVGLAEELELAAIRAALSHFDELPAGVGMGLNGSPAVVSSPAFHKTIAGVDTSLLIAELTEHTQVEDYDRLRAAIADLRASGVYVSVDDTGSGFASLSHVLATNPDSIKLDRSLVRDIDTDPARQSLVSSLVDFSQDSQMLILGEGVETAAELATLQRLGIGYVQGYYLARPGPLESVLAIDPGELPAPETV